MATAAGPDQPLSLGDALEALLPRWLERNPGVTRAAYEMTVGTTDLEVVVTVSQAAQAPASPDARLAPSPPLFADGMAVLVDLIGLQPCGCESADDGTPLKRCAEHGGAHLAAGEAAAPLHGSLDNTGEALIGEPGASAAPDGPRGGGVAAPQTRAARGLPGAQRGR